MHEMTATTETPRSETAAAPPRALAAGMTTIRIMFGLIYLSNTIVKFTGQFAHDFGFFQFNLITQGAARNILSGAVNGAFEPLATIYGEWVLPNWGVFQWFLTFTELLIAVLLLFGIASRLAPLIALGLIAPIWIMLWAAPGYLWTYPVELIPLVVLVIVPTGRTLGFDRVLAPRFGNRWPF